MIVGKKVHLNLVGIDGNAFSVMGTWKNQARKEKWTKEEMDAVLNEARSGDYNHLLVTIMDHCDMNEDENDSDDYCEDCGFPAEICKCLRFEDNDEEDEDEDEEETVN